MTQITLDDSNTDSVIVPIPVPFASHLLKSNSTFIVKVRPQFLSGETSVSPQTDETSFLRPSAMFFIGRNDIDSSSNRMLSVKGENESQLLLSFIEDKLALRYFKCPGKSTTTRYLFEFL